MQSRPGGPPELILNQHQAVARRRALQFVRRRQEQQELNRRDGTMVGSSDLKKQDGVLRFAFQNINGFGLGTQTKDIQIFQFMADRDIDMMGMAEGNINWQKMGPTERLWDRTRGWFENRSLNCAHNTTEPRLSSRSQPGGVASMATNAFSTKVEGSGKDPTGLGRWIWTHFGGKNGMKLKVFTIYRPCDSKGVNTTFMQQLRYLQKDQDDRNPRRALLEDLGMEVEKSTDEGFSVIILGDFNEDCRGDDITQWREQHNLTDYMLDTIGIEQAPRTYARGSKPIDSIMGSPNVRVLKAAYLPFGEGAGDHRPLMVDIDQQSVLGVAGEPSGKLRARRLKMKDPRVVKKYLEVLNKFYIKHKLFKKVNHLNALPITYPLLQQTALLYEEVDRIRVQGMKLAEKKCRKLHGGKIPWSPEVTAAHLVVELWTLVVRRLKGCHVSAKTILRKKKQAGYHGETNINLAEALQLLQESYATYRTVIKTGEERRSTYINDLAAAKAKAGKVSAANALKTMVEQEAIRSTWARIHRMDGSARNSRGLSMVVAQDEDGQWRDKVTRKDIEEATLSENERRFTQSLGTPFTISPMVEELGLLGTSQAADDILQGDYTPPAGTGRDMQTILDHLQCPDSTQIKTQPNPITCEEYRRGWRKVKEKISSSPTGLHVGHWKCGSLDNTINWVNASMANIPYLSGYSPSRWQQGINVMIEKKKGNYRVDRLRTILLYEADFNMNNKYLGRDMMQQAEKRKILANEQYGSRKKKAAILHALNKRLTFDILRQQKQNAGICSCDLKSCYDRIVHSFAALAMRRAGAAESSTTSMFSTIQKLQHKVRTAFGDSEGTFGGEEWREVQALMGVGQGNGAGPAIWAVISTVFFDVLRSNGYGALLTAPFSRRELKIAGFGFVDDTDLIQTGLSLEDYWEVAAKLQAAVNLWEACTEASGGCLVPDKSWWTLVDFTWYDGEWKYTSNMDDVDLSIKDSGGIDRKLVQLASWEAQKMLGVWLAPDGNNKKQIEEMRKQSVEWGSKVKTGAICRQDAWRAMNMTIMKTLEYPLVALTLTEKECDYIMAPVLAGGLPRAGICRNIPRSVLYGSLEHQGLGMHNLYNTMGLQQIQVLLDNTWKNTITGKLIRTSLESFKLELGIQGPLFTKDYELYNNIATDCWIKHLWHFVRKHSIEIDEDTDSGGMLRTGDKFLGEIFADAYSKNMLLKQDWRAVNRCRLFLKLLTVADLTTGDGQEVDEAMLRGKTSHGRVRDIKWPTQGKPSTHDWKCWRRVIRQTLCKNRVSRLEQTLGQWIEPIASKVLPNWQWFWDDSHECLYKNCSTHWERYVRDGDSGVRGSNLVFILRDVLPSLGDEVRICRATVVRSHDGVKITGGIRTMSSSLQTISESEEEWDTIQDEEPLEDNFDRNILNPQGHKWAARVVYRTPSISSILQDIRDGKVIGVSDGSFKDKLGTACWILEDASGSERIVGLVEVPGHDDEHDAYRSELAGLFGLVIAVNTLLEIGKISTGEIEVGCDGLSALHRSFWHEVEDISSANAHFDILSELHGVKKGMDVNWKYRHIAGHQEDVAGAVLDRWALLNIECDIRAKDYWAQLKGTRQNRQFNMKKGMWQIRIHGMTVGTNLFQYLRKAIQGGGIFEYWVDKRKRVGEANVGLIDWEAQGKALKSLKQSRRQWVSKFVSGWCGTGKMMKRWKQRVTSSCPRCNNPVEDNTHILECKAVGARAEWTLACKKVDDWLNTATTCPELTRLVIKALDNWKDKKPIVYDSDLDFPGIKKLLEAQEKIGWRLFFDGCLALEWAQVQQKYYDWIGSRKSGRKWVRGLIRQLWEVAFSAWEHRNSVLHDTPLADIMNGTLSLDRALRREWELGFEGLPDMVKVTIPRTITHILNGSVADRKGWFVLIRTARENCGDDSIEDEFSSPSSSLRKWVGL